MFSEPDAAAALLRIAALTGLSADAFLHVVQSHVLDCALLSIATLYSSWWESLGLGMTI